MQFTATAIPDVILVEPRVFRDARGFFFEFYHAEKYRAGGIDVAFVQDNHSLSQRGALRGLHAQLRSPQGKLIRVIEGEIFDVAVDVRRGSPSFAKHVSAVLSAENVRQLWIPPGFVHGFQVLSERAQVEYKCTALYDPGDEIAIAWNDPDLAIPWPETPERLLSPKDQAAPLLRDVMERLPRYGA